MFRKIRLLAGSVLLVSVVVSAACTADAPVSATPTPPTAVPAAAPAAATQAAATTASVAPGGVATSAVQAADADEMICKRVDVLGSRVRKERVCKSKGEWALIEQQKRETFRSIDRASGAGPDPALGGG